jgi:hypothetical protein
MFGVSEAAQDYAIYAFGMVMMAFAGWITSIIKKAADSASTAAANAAAAAIEVKTTLATTSSATDKKLSSIQRVVDGTLGTALEANAVSLRTLATITNSPDAERAAVAAERAAADHKQAMAAEAARTEKDKMEQRHDPPHPPGALP